MHFPAHTEPITDLNSQRWMLDVVVVLVLMTLQLLPETQFI